MKFGFSRNNNLIGSILIRWGTSDSFLKLDPVSHFLVIFDDRLVFESNLQHGVHVSMDIDSIDIVKTFEPVRKIDLKVDEEVYQELLDMYGGSSYDLAGVLYLTWRVFLKKFFGKPIPQKNIADIPNQQFCIEVIEAVNRILRARGIESPIPDKDYSMTTPTELMNLFSTLGGLVECQKT